MEEESEEWADERSNQSLLKEIVIENSVSGVWESAKKEWTLLYIYDKKNLCICRHDIFENCVIQNKENGNELTVGNVCINQFKEDCLIVEEKARSCLKKIRTNPNKSKANEQLLELAVRTGVLSIAEKEYYMKITKKGKNSRNKFDKEHEKYDSVAHDARTRFNRLICLGFASNRPKCECGVLAKPRHKHTYFYGCVNWNPDGVDCCKFTKSAF